MITKGNHMVISMRMDSEKMRKCNLCQSHQIHYNHHHYMLAEGWYQSWNQSLNQFLKKGEKASLLSQTIIMARSIYTKTS